MTAPSAPTPVAAARPSETTGSTLIARLPTITTVVFFIVLIVLPFVLGEYDVGLMTGWFPLALGALGLNLLTGYNGQISLGHGALFGVGAYTAAILVGDHGWTMLGGVVAAGAVAFVIGLIIGLPALRIRGFYLAVVTFVLAALFTPLVVALADLTGGAKGFAIRSLQPYRGGMKLRPVKWETPSGLGLANDQWNYVVYLAITAVMFVLVRNLIRSRTGRAIIAVRDNEIAAAANGINVAATKVLTFGVSAALAGMGGALLALHDGQVYPTTFTFALSLTLLVAVVTGGSATIMGPAVGALGLGLFSDVLQPSLPERFQPATALILGVLLIVAVLLAPGGTVGSLRDLLHKFQKSRAAADGDAAASAGPTRSAPEVQS